MALIISQAIEAKIGDDTHGNVSREEVDECFENHDGRYCEENRPEHKDSDGVPSLWFVGETNHRRKLKIMFVRRDRDIYLKSAYPATTKVCEIYKRFCR